MSKILSAIEYALLLNFQVGFKIEMRHLFITIQNESGKSNTQALPMDNHFNEDRISDLITFQVNSFKSEP